MEYWEEVLELLEKRKSGMSAQGKKTPRMMRRDKRRRKAVGVKGLEEEEEERRDNNGFGPENENGL